MLAQAISSTMPTTTIRIIERRTTGAPPVPVGFRRASSSGTAPALRPLLSTGKACSSPAKTVRMLRRRLLDGDVRLQAAERKEEQAAPLLVPVEVRLHDVVHRHRHPARRVAAEERAGEPLRRDADDGERRAVERQRLADDRGIAIRGCAPRSRG